MACAGSRKNESMESTSLEAPVNSEKNGSKQASHSHQKGANQALSNLLEVERDLAKATVAEDFEECRLVARELIREGDGRERSVGRFWNTVCLLRQRRFDSAQAQVRASGGDWQSPMRRALIETLMEMSIAVQTRDSGPKNGGAKLENMERRIAELQAEIERLLAENRRYEKLLKDLDRLP